jgi:hypothetical protein
MLHFSIQKAVPVVSWQRDEQIKCFLCSQFKAQCTTSFNMQKLCILPTEGIYAFHMILKINIDYFPEQE